MCGHAPAAEGVSGDVILRKGSHLCLRTIGRSKCGSEGRHPSANSPQGRSAKHAARRGRTEGCPTEQCSVLHQPPGAVRQTGGFGAAKVGWQLGYGVVKVKVSAAPA